jgi:hypothetical protein
MRKLLNDLRQQCVERDVLASGDIQLLDFARARRAHMILHFHRLKDHQRLPDFHRIAHGYQHARDLAGDGRFDPAIGAGRAGHRCLAIA